MTYVQMTKSFCSRCLSLVNLQSKDNERERYSTISRQYLEFALVKLNSKGQLFLKRAYGSGR